MPFVTSTCFRSFRLYGDQALRNFYFTTVWKFFENLSEVKKIIMWSSIQVLPNQVKKFFYTLEDIDSRESHAKLHKSRVKLWEQIEFKVSTLFLGTLTDCRCTLHSVRLQKSKVHLLSFKKRPYQKILTKKCL